MLKSYKYSINGYIQNESSNNSKIQKNSCNKKEKITEKHKTKSSKSDSDSMDNLDTFFTLLLKTLTPKERFLLLNKLLSVDWDNPEESLEKYLKELIDQKKDNEEELKKTLGYDNFLWSFNNWKKFFLSDE